MPPLSLGYSPCPNDTFIFGALVHGNIPEAPPCREILEDIETLNAMALECELDLTKISFHAFGHLRESYVLLGAGGALGRGCGPLIVAGEPMASDQLEGKRIALPGKLTTASLLLRLFNPSLQDLIYMPFHQIIPACHRGEVDAGVIIHESRFTYAKYGLHRVMDLGTWWEEETRHPIPLGGIVARRNLGPSLCADLEKAIRRSVEYAYEHPNHIRPYIRQYAQEMEEDVMQQHIDLYVNHYTLQYGDDGKNAINHLIDQAVEIGIIPASDHSVF